MRKHFLTSGAAALMAFVVATGHAAILVEYDFEGSGAATAGLPVSTAAVIPVGKGDFAGAGKIGSSSASLTSSTGAWVDVTVPKGGDAWGTNNSGHWSGSFSFWFQASSHTTSSNFFTSRNPTYNMGIYSPNTSGAAAVFYMPSISSHPTTTGPAIADSSWHLLTATWTTTTGVSGTGSQAFYVDGSYVGGASNIGTATSATVYTSAGMAALGVDIASTGVPKTNASQIGLYDNYAAWNSVLSATEVTSLYNLGNSTLNYGAAPAQQLFDLYAAGSGTATIGSTQWANVASGLGTTAGAVVDLGGGILGLNLGGASGAGVQIQPALTRLIVNGGTVTKPSTDAQVMPPGPGADIQAGMLVLDYTGQSDPAATVKSLLTTAYGSAFASGQFISTTADAIRGLGWVDNTGTSKISIARTVYGDVDLNGTVGLSDLGKVLTNWGVGNKWGDGDVDYNAAVGLSDLGKVLTNWGLSVGALTPAANAVPEPSTLALLAVLAGLAGAWAVRRRK